MCYEAQFLVIICVAAVLAGGIWAWHDVATRTNPDVVTFDEIKDLLDRVATAEANIKALFAGCTCQLINAENAGVK